MRNWYNRKWLVLHEPVSDRRGRTFERKLAEVVERGFKPVGSPTFSYVGPDKVLYGTILLKT